MNTVREPSTPIQTCTPGDATPLLDKEGLPKVLSRLKNPPLSSLGKGGGKKSNLPENGADNKVPFSDTRRSNGPVALTKGLDPETLLSRCLGEVHRVDSTLHLTAPEWESVVRLACSRWLGGLLLEGAQRHDWPIPQRVVPELYGQALRIQFANNRLMDKLRVLVGALQRQGVPVLLLKGAALNLTLYERRDTRPMSDLDLLIHPQHVDLTLATLMQHGCRIGVPLVRNDFFPKYHYEMELCTEEPNPVRIDLHVRPLRPMRTARTLPDDALWSDAQALRLTTGDMMAGYASTNNMTTGRVSTGYHTPYDPQAYVPRSEMMLIHLAAHAAFHGCSRWLWLYDIKRLTDRFDGLLDWDLFLDRTHQWRLSTAVYRALSETEKLFRSVVPDRVMESLRTQRTTWRDRLVLFQAPHDATSPLAHVSVNLLCTPGIRYRCGYLLAQLFPGRAHMAGVYPLRHPGWLLCAHLWRGLRIPLRMLFAPWQRYSKKSRASHPSAWGFESRMNPA